MDTKAKKESLLEKALRLRSENLDYREKSINAANERLGQQQTRDTEEFSKRTKEHNEKEEALKKREAELARKERALKLGEAAQTFLEAFVRTVNNPLCSCGKPECKGCAHSSSRGLFSPFPWFMR